jgi:hypothetical protein
MKKRTVISAPDLYHLLDREFTRRRPRACDVCYLQMPFRVERPDPDAPNWEVPLPLHCSAACRVYAEEAVAKLAEVFELDAAPH